MPSPSSDPVAELADLQQRFALAVAARDDLLVQCRALLALVEQQQRRVRELESWCEQQAARPAGG